MDFMLYPTFQIVEDRGMIPNIHLPRNTKDLVPLFYEQGRKEEITDYVSNLEDLLKKTPDKTKIKLNWDDKKGLTMIKIGTASGLDLNELGIPSFQEHNLGGNFPYIAMAVATKYISELLKSK